MRLFLIFGLIYVNIFRASYTLVSFVILLLVMLFFWAFQLILDIHNLLSKSTLDVDEIWLADLPIPQRAI